nr:hypothetical protein [Halomonas sp.]
MAKTLSIQCEKNRWLPTVFISVICASQQRRVDSQISLCASL